MSIYCNSSKEQVSLKRFIQKKFWSVLKVCDRWLYILLAFRVLFLSVVVTGSGFAQNTSSNGQGASAESLTHNLTALNTQYQVAGRADKSKLLNNLLTLAAEREQLLSTLIEDNPGEVLRVAIPAHIRATLPSAAQAYVEMDEEVEGDLEVLYEDRDQGSRTLYFIEAAGKRLSLHFAAEPPTELLTGSHIRVHGVRVDGALALTSGSTSVQTLSAALPNTFGEQKTIVILVNFQDETTKPYTPAAAQSIVFTTTSNFDMENSFQQAWLTGDVYGWYTIPMSSTVCDQSTLASYANQAATAAGAILSQYTRYVYAFPQNACTWWGLSTVGGNPSQAWINGSLALKVVSHEMGHNFGLYHSHSLDCGTTTLGSNCTVSEYGDTLDTMGNPSAGHFNAFQKERLGWLNYGASPPITTVQSNGTYAIAPYESVGTNPKALKILKSTDPTTGANTWYYIEYRQAIGFDNFLSTNSNVLNGVVVHTGTDSSGNSSDLLDMTPATSSWSDPALDVGQSFYDPDSGVAIVPISVSSNSATVSVSFGALACVSANPTMTLSPSQSQWVQAGTAATYTVTVTNNDNAGCTSSSFNMQTTAPSGWTAAFGSSTLTISPGSSASTTLSVTSPTSATGGFYNIGVTATNSANMTYAASASVTYVIVSALNIVVSTNQSSYSRGQTVTTTAIVSANGSPVANASVTFTIMKSNGTTVTGTSTTGTNGSAVLTYRLKKNDPVGTYQAKAVASMNGISGSATTSFNVH